MGVRMAPLRDHPSETLIDEFGAGVRPSLAGPPTGTCRIVPFAPDAARSGDRHLAEQSIRPTTKYGVQQP